MSDSGKNRRNTPITATALRADLYRMLDAVIETGVPLMVTHKGRSLTINVEPHADRITAIVPIPDLIVGDIDVDWTKHWDADENLNPS